MNYIGIDVSKDTLDLGYYVNTEAHTEKIPNTSEEIKNYLLGQNRAEMHFIFESTGSYHLTLAYTLEEQGFKLTILNPMAARGFAHSFLTTTKTDAQDALYLARFGMERQPTPTRLPSVSWQQRRQTFNYWQDLLKEKNRLENQLHSLKQWDKSSPFVSEKLEAKLRFLEEQIIEVKSCIEDTYQGTEIEEEKRNVQNVSSIKGIGSKTTFALLFFTDHLRSFESAKELAKFIGIVPFIRESGKSRKRGSISKRGNPYLRSLLYNCARSAAQHNPACKILYTRLRDRGKTYKQALIAVAHKLIRQVFAVVKSGKPFDPKLT